MRKNMSRTRADIISSIASIAYIIVIIAQIPLFRFPCGIGACHTPLEVVSCQLITSEIFPHTFLKVLLYPGAIRKSFEEYAALPNPNQVLDSYKSKTKAAPATTQVEHLEVIVGSYLCVAGAFLQLVKSGRMSVAGLILTLWGIWKGTNSPGGAQCLRPMLYAIIFAFFSVRRDLRKLFRVFEA